MSDADKVEFSLKVMMNREKTKVLFAEADSNLADVLLSFLTLPLGTIVRLLKKHYGDEAPVFGSLTTLYKGLANLDDVHFWTEAGKLMLLNPRSSFQDECSKLKLNIDDTDPTKYFTCETHHCDYRWTFFSMYYGTATCRCGKTMNREIAILNLSQAADGDGVFTIKTASFVVSDDLRMAPNISGSFIQTLNNLGITDTDGAEQRTVTVGFNEVMDLLKGSLFSRTPLTDLIVHRRQKTNSVLIKSEPNVLSDQIEKKETPKTEEKMMLKVLVQKSTNRVLFAQAEENFIDFLSSFLAIPLAGVESVLVSNSCLKNIDNLHRSSANLNNYLKTQATKNNLFNPDIPPIYPPKNHIFFLSGQRTPELYYRHVQNQEFLSSHSPHIYSQPVDIIYPNRLGSYVMGPGMYMVRDDLTVTPLCLSSGVTILNEMKIQLSDVLELDIDIGLEEGLNILKASLTSTCALSNGLSSILKKQPKQEN